MSLILLLYSTENKLDQTGHKVHSSATSFHYAWVTCQEGEN